MRGRNWADEPSSSQIKEKVGIGRNRVKSHVLIRSLSRVVYGHISSLSRVAYGLISSLSRVAYERIVSLSWVAHTKLTPVFVARRNCEKCYPPGRVAFPRQAMNYSFNCEVNEKSVLRPQSNLNLQKNHSTSAKPNAINCQFTADLTRYFVTKQNFTLQLIRCISGHKSTSFTFLTTLCFYPRRIFSHTQISKKSSQTYLYIRVAISPS